MPQAVIPNRTIPILLFVDGLGILFLSIFASVIGLDPNPDWGPSRFALLAFGLLWVLVSLYLTWSKKIKFSSSENFKTVFLFAHLWIFVFLVYAWFITYGTFTTWEKSTRYYAHLADAFSKGQLNVDIVPNVELVEARDPYDSENRPHFDDEMWDMSLYKEKLYIYWGPVPALLMLPFQARSDKLLLDMYLVYGFLCGLFAINSLLILKLWKRLFSDVPVGNVLAAMFLTAFLLPILWSLNVPDVYEAAIGAGQFFLMGGIYFAFLAMDTGRKRYLFLAGLFWACSVGSRAINVFSVVFLFVSVSLWVFRKHSGSLQYWKKSLSSILYLTIPLMLGAILIGAYNWARFGSPFEFGLRYQITIYNLNRDSSLSFRPEYFPLNLYAYGLQPFKVISTFPLLRPVHVSSFLNSLKIAQPKLYAAGSMAGILFSTPFLLLSFLPFLSKNRSTVKPNSTDERQLKKLFLLLVAGSLLINSLIILFYYYGQMRFLVDFISQAALLAVIGYWELVQRNRASTSKRARAYVHLAHALLVITLVFSFLLSFTSETQRFEKFNPTLVEKINSIFTVQ
ncbi:MAG: hypothetical protein QM730_11790 [Anaerolineales bacterium]